MKKLLIILSLILFSCGPSPEQKIIKSFEDGRHRNHFKINNVSIYDTIYYVDIIDSLEFYENKVRLIRKQIDGLRGFRDSVFKLNYPDSTRRSILQKRFDLDRELQRDLHHASSQQMNRYTFYNMNDSICGYLVKIYTPRDTFDFVVTSKYAIVCPTFMFY